MRMMLYRKGLAAIYDRMMILTTHRSTPDDLDKQAQASKTQNNCNPSIDQTRPLLGGRNWIDIFHTNSEIKQEDGRKKNGARQCNSKCNYSVHVQPGQLTPPRNTNPKAVQATYRTQLEALMEISYSEEHQLRNSHLDCIRSDPV
ncbi:hypothetical protein AA313_de0203443 [Arthrobotrys entomopaga]|nr:hypothetical protein AA313_de0203443 [Arthrobotrys entomopaga]